MSKESVLERIAQFGIVPVITIEEVAHALPLADALLAGGLPVIEITFRTSAAAEVVRVLAKERPQLLIGAGTLLTASNIEAAKASGAVFGVAPGLNPQIVERARELDLPFIPGIATPSEIEIAMSLGCRLLKYFPADALGGPAMLDAMAAPYKHTGVRFMPSGGVNTGNLENYLKVGCVAAAGGTWLARLEDLKAGNWTDVAARCKAAVETVARARRR
jgi:2-dehydro-3-deoxyphosphogluconate aldolase/(4S)-4-hydroxy-2-oxoglutarate aldolase